MSPRGRTPRPADLRVHVSTDGTLRGTTLTLPSGLVIRNLQALDVHVGTDGASCTATIGQVAVDYGPASLDATDAELHLQPGPTPRQ